MTMEFETGQIVTTKKCHPCGCNQWEIVRTGADFMVKCTKCGRQVMMSRTKFLKSLKQ